MNYLNDLKNFTIKPHSLKSGEKVYLVLPRHIGCKWNKDNLIFRSSVWNAQGKPVSLSFKKFFNWGEKPDLTYTPSSLTANGGCQAVNKEDGSTLIFSKYKGEMIVRTRVTLDATSVGNGFEIEELKKRYPRITSFAQNLDTWNYSLIFEWVSPNHKIIVNYDKPDLYLIGIVNHLDYSLIEQKELDFVAKSLGVKRPQVYNFPNIKVMLEQVALFKDKEGICLYCNKGQDIRKIKSEWYLKLHRLKNELNSFEKIMDLYLSFYPDLMSCKDFYNHILEVTDFEIAEQVKGNILKICDCTEEAKRNVEEIKKFIDKLKEKCKDRKNQALEILKVYGKTPQSAICFSILNGKGLTQEQLKKMMHQFQSRKK